LSLVEREHRENFVDVAVRACRDESSGDRAMTGGPDETGDGFGDEIERQPEDVVQDERNALGRKLSQSAPVPRPTSHPTEPTERGADMSRIPAHTVEDAPEASRELLRNVIQFSPTRQQPLNMHAQMAHSPAVLVAYTSLRAATAEHGKLGPKVSSALMLATASAIGNDYVIAITSRLAAMMGWTDNAVAALRAGITLGDNPIDVLTGVVREAAANAGNVKDTTWTTARRGGWNDEQLAEAFVYLGLTVFTAYFLNYAQTEIDV
jgi:hypothetical protein